MSPFERMLDDLAWAVIPQQPGAESDLPYATHEGRLMFGAFTLRVYQLSNGMRVIDADDIEKFFNGGTS